MSAEKTLEERLADLTTAYVASLPERMNQIEQARDQWANTHETDDGPAALKSLHASAHKLAGSAATYGFHDLGTIASELEIACHCQMGIAADDMMPPPGIEAIASLVRSVEVQLNAVMGDPQKLT
jgi:HPt (histidine-containing phosphotransfer) domain-containing protein